MVQKEIAKTRPYMFKISLSDKKKLKMNKTIRKHPESLCDVDGYKTERFLNLLIEKKCAKKYKEKKTKPKNPKRVTAKTIRHMIYILCITVRPS